MPKMNNAEFDRVMNIIPEELDFSNEKTVNEERGAVYKALVISHQKAAQAEKAGNREEDLEHQVNYYQLSEKLSRIDDLAKENNTYMHTTETSVRPTANKEQFKFPDTHGNGMQGGQNKNVQIWESVSGKNKGSEIKVLNNRASLADQHRGDFNQQNTPTWNQYLRARIAGHTGDYSLMGDGPKNLMSTTSDTAMVPTPLSTEVIDLARSKSRIFEAGARVFEMSSKTETIARVTSDPNAQWKEENAAHTDSDVVTEPLTFTSKTLIASVKMSVELSEDAPNGSNIIENSLADQLALELDRAALLGSGAGAEPQGVFGYTGVQSEALTAALADYDPFSLAYQKVLQANGMPNGIIYAPRTWGTLDRLKDSQNQPLNPPASYADLPKYQTTQVPIDLGTGNDESLAFVGDWEQMMIGVRTNIRIEITRVGSDTSNSAWENLQVWVRAYLRADMQLAQPGHFCVIEGIL